MLYATLKQGLNREYFDPKSFKTTGVDLELKRSPCILYQP